MKGVESKQSLFSLSMERVLKIFEENDYHYLYMPKFPQFSKRIKIRLHDSIIISGDTGVGKSSLAINFLHELQDRYPVLYVNLEMDEAVILQRLAAIHSGLDLDRIEGYSQDGGTREQVNAAMREILGRKEFVLLSDTYDLADIESRIKEVTADRKEPTIVFIDTGLLVHASGKSASRYERFTQISEELRRIARTYNVIVFILLQQNRDGKKGKNAEPENSSLKESGSWENDATKIMFLRYDPESKRKELVVTKNRSGERGKIRLNYDPHTQTYSEVNDSFVSENGLADASIPEKAIKNVAAKRL